MLLKVLKIRTFAKKSGRRREGEMERWGEKERGKKWQEAVEEKAAGDCGRRQWRINGSRQWQ